MGKGDRLVAWSKTPVRPDWLERDIWRQMPEEMTIREIEVSVSIPGFRARAITLVTTLLDARLFAKTSFAELHRRRWPAELFPRDMKISTGMDVVKCKTPDVVIKELTLYLIAYNLIRSLMFPAAQAHGVAPVSPNAISIPDAKQTLRRNCLPLRAEQICAAIPSS